MIKRIFALTLVLGFLVAVAGCNVPRIIVLDDPLTGEEHLQLGMAYEKRGEIDAALKEYEQAAGKRAIANLYLGNIYFSRKEPEKAEAYYRKALEAKDDPRAGDAYNNLAWLYYTKKERLDDAEDLVLKAMGINPGGRENYEDTLRKIRNLKKQLPTHHP